MKKNRLQLAMMVMAILGIAGFQLFWLAGTYRQEKKSLTVKTNLAFRNVIQDLQASKIKLDSNPVCDTARKMKVKMLVNDTLHEDISVSMNNRKGIVSTINVIRKGLPAYHPIDSSLKGAVFISKTSDIESKEIDLPGMESIDSAALKRNGIIRLLYRVDSLQDSLTLREVDSAFAASLYKQHLGISYQVSRRLSDADEFPSSENEITIGFARPVTYKMELKNNFPYLLKQVAMPVLFSILLLGITIASFVLLYRNLKKQRRLTEIKNEFIGNITHELKTPIATVSVAVEAMKNFNALNNPERTREYLDISASELQRLSLLVDKVLSLSRFEKKQVEIRKEKFDIVVLIREVMESMKPQFEKYQAATSLQMTGYNFLIEADRKHISSVVYNLLDNALKYSSQQPKIDVLLNSTDEFIELQVADNGIGIPKEYNRKIFEQFFRVPNGDKHNVKGYGLGLSYVNFIVLSHGGTIEVNSSEGKGSVFVIKLPYHDKMNKHEA